MKKISIILLLILCLIFCGCSLSQSAFLTIFGEKPSGTVEAPIDSPESLHTSTQASDNATELVESLESETDPTESSADKFPETSEEQTPDQPSDSPSAEVSAEEEIPDENEQPLGPAYDPEKPMIALTFDDGPSKHTERLLDIFATHGGKATFFLLGNIIDRNPEPLKRMAEEGHEIGGHSWDHRLFTKQSVKSISDQITLTQSKILEITGVQSNIIRPPYGTVTENAKRACTDLGVIMVNWSVDTLDWENRDADYVYDAIMNTVKDGDIILCHDIYSTTVDAMERAIPDLITQGYQLVTVSELLSYSEEGIIAGNVYKKK